MKNNRQMKTRLKLFMLFFVLFAVLGYWRELFFVQINNIMYMKYYNMISHLAVPSYLQFFQAWEYNTLYYGKYFFTVLWTMIFFTANYFALKKLTSEKIFIHLLIYAYLIMFILAGCSMLYGYFINHRWNEDEYTLSRWLMGIAQSPLVALILLASEKLYNSTNVRH